ncbi:MAG TPA: type III-B CRISPR module-associated Cmr3 family protein [Rhodocyclaceae bacterium]|nr:type III-B CRISPR module-associated Cmr3 family protein [Rhodocyclaceae bacterium]
MHPTAHTLLIEPLDMLILRGNKLFADASSHGEALMPPWPSVVAGALRSRMLADAGIDPAAFAEGKAKLEPALADSLGSVEHPGTFRISHFGLARNTGNDDAPALEALLPLPADLNVDQDGHATPLQPTGLHPALASSHPLPLTPVLHQPEAGKPKGGLWLTAAGIAAWQHGEPLDNEQGHWLAASELWKVDQRLGIALEAGKNTAAEGQLYTSEAIALKPGIAFIARVQGADGVLPDKGLLRFGGDGRAAHVRRADCKLPMVDSAELARAGRFRLLLTNPGLFPQGWRLPSMGDTKGDGRWHFHGASARLACAAVPRLETVSGWDVAHRRPKSALRAVPAGGVYWLEDFRGDPGALDALQTDGLPHLNATRRAEGFNTCLLAHWN